MIGYPASVCNVESLQEVYYRFQLATPLEFVHPRRNLVVIQSAVEGSGQRTVKAQDGKHIPRVRGGAGHVEYAGHADARFLGDIHRRGRVRFGHIRLVNGSCPCHALIRKPSLVLPTKYKAPVDLSVLVAKTLNYRKPCFSHPTWDDGSVRSDICQLGWKG